MFWSFATVAYDQIVNNAGQIRYMSGGLINCPIVLRGPANRGTNVGAAHCHTRRDSRPQGLIRRYRLRCKRTNEILHSRPCFLQVVTRNDSDIRAVMELTHDRKTEERVGPGDDTVKLGNTSPRTAIGTITDRKAFAP